MQHINMVSKYVHDEILSDQIMSCYDNFFIFYVIKDVYYTCGFAAGETGQVCVFDLRTPSGALLTYQEHSRAIHRMRFCSVK